MTLTLTFDLDLSISSESLLLCSKPEVIQWETQYLPTVGANSAQLSFAGTELYRFEISIGCNAKFCNV